MIVRATGNDFSWSFAYYYFFHSVVQLIYDQKIVTYTQHDKRLIIENILKTKARAIWDKKKQITTQKQALSKSRV